MVRDVGPVVAIDEPLTRVVLRRRFKRRRDRLRFGAWVESRTTGPGERTLWLVPGVVFCLVRWRGDEYGTTRWQLFIARTGAPGDALTCLPGVLPGAHALATLSGVPRVRRALSALRTFERDGVELADVPPSYWRHFQEQIMRARDVTPPSRARTRCVELRRGAPP